ncbi:Hint domain-containing protein [Fangia hongkongensis]|nr:Hint domain-containing protein [Fangia hongkongensis]MBK2123905.1 hypothetical protein [Fangia hongkongensis]
MSFNTVIDRFIYSNKQICQVETSREHIYCTKSHPFYVRKKGFVQAEKLIKGKELKCLKETSWCQINAVKDKEITATVYDLTVEHTHTFFVSSTGIWVHNSGGDVRKREFNSFMLEKGLNDIGISTSLPDNTTAGEYYGYQLKRQRVTSLIVDPKKDSLVRARALSGRIKTSWQQQFLDSKSLTEAYGHLLAGIKQTNHKDLIGMDDIGSLISNNFVKRDSAQPMQLSDQHYETMTSNIEFIESQGFEALAVEYANMMQGMLLLTV